ncbi:MAG: hypothetical protein WKF77_30350 [Planctomycetaceae bacterium]
MAATSGGACGIAADALRAEYRDSVHRLGAAFYEARGNEELQITVRDGKGEKDRITMLPNAAVHLLERQL